MEKGDVVEDWDRPIELIQRNITDHKSGIVGAMLYLYSMETFIYAKVNTACRH